MRPQLEDHRHRDAPGHPLSRIISQVPAPSQETFDDRNLIFRETINIGGKSHRFGRTSQGGIGNRRSKDFAEGRRFFFALAHDYGTGDQIADALIAVGGKDRYQSYRIKHDRLDVKSPQEISHHRFKETYRATIIPDHTQLQP